MFSALVSEPDGEAGTGQVPTFRAVPMLDWNAGVTNQISDSLIADGITEEVF